MPATTVHAAFLATAARTPGAGFLQVEAVTAAAYGIEAQTISWRDAAAEVERLRAAYAAAGYGHGHRVGLLLENRPAFLLHWFALNALGASVVPIHAELRQAELEYLVGHSEICLAVTLPARAAELRRAAAAAGARIAIAIGDASSDTLPDAPTAPPAPSRGDAAIGEHTECALLYTSGTTGRPKGCRLSNAYILRCGRWYAALNGLCTMRRDAERVITPLPLAHVNAMAFSAMVVVVAGGCLIQLDRFHPERLWRSVRESEATLLHYLGVMPAMLLAAAPAAADRDHAVRWAFGAGVDRRHHAAFEQRFGFPLIEAWAMTETGAAACVIANHEPRHPGHSCFGRAPASMHVRVVAAEAGAGDVADDRQAAADATGATPSADSADIADAGDTPDAADGEPGELLVRAAGDDPRRDFFSGYLKDDAATEAAWAGGWFHTGDVVRRDADGNLYFVDRRKNVIRRSGENISALEVESVLNQHPAVQASAVAAAPDTLRGDEVLACVVVRERTATDDDRRRVAASIVEHALAQLAYYKAPGYVAFVDALPLTASQKIQRGELRELARSLPGQPHCIDTRSMKKRQP